MEKRSLKMHPKLLMDVIQRQAGTLEKAVLEGVMNGLEAGAPQINIGFAVQGDAATLTISDAGKGIVDKHEIENFFETFGTPHDESEGKVWAQFRMGRGQLFSFGVNTWRTSQFRMNVDIKGKGLEYGLEENLDVIDGCEISVALYRNPIGYSYHSIDALKDAITRLVEFMPSPIYFNGEQINKIPTEMSWTEETDDAYYLFGQGIGDGVTVYNMGALVMTIPSHRAGTSGVVVSKDMLKVNFARNDIQDDCEIYERIRDVIKANRIKKTRSRRQNLCDTERIALLTDIRNGELKINEQAKVGLLRTSSGNVIKLSDIRKNRLDWGFAERGNQRADKLMQQGKGLFIDYRWKDMLNYRGKDAKFFVWLAEASYQHHYRGPEKLEKDWGHTIALHSEFEVQAQGLSESYSIFTQKQLSSQEKYILRTLDSFSYLWQGRMFFIGCSDIASAWTDGKTRIVLDRNWLKRIHVRSASGASMLANVIAHELSHDEDSHGTHVHGPEFYERFHELSLSDRAPQRIIAQFQSKMKDSKTMMRQEADEAKAAKAEAKRNKALGVKDESAVAAYPQ